MPGWNLDDIALDLLSWLDQRGQDLRDLTQADLDRWLTYGTSTRRAVRYFLQWAHGRGLAGDLNVPLPPRQEPERLLAERDHIHQLDRCLTDEAMPLDLRVGGALVLLVGMLVSRIIQLTKDDVIEDNQATWLAIDGHRLMLPTRLASLVRQLRDQEEPRWTLSRLGTPVPWLFPGQSPRDLDVHVSDAALAGTLMADLLVEPVTRMRGWVATAGGRAYAGILIEWLADARMSALRQQRS